MTIGTQREKALLNAESLFRTRYHDAEYCIASGSIIQGHGVAHSDLDIVVIYSNTPAAYRESFFFRGMPVEAFVHDYETIRVFMDDDCRRGTASMQHMIASGVVVPQVTEASAKLISYARQAIDAGLQSSPEKIQSLRYAIGDLIDDLRDDRPVNEVRSILYSLYSSMAELRLRLSGEFVGMGKHMARKISQCDPAFARDLESILEKAHITKLTGQDIESLLSLAASMGGCLFDGYKQYAPPEMRMTAKWLDVPGKSEV